MKIPLQLTSLGWGVSKRGDIYPFYPSTEVSRGNLPFKNPQNILLTVIYISPPIKSAQVMSMIIINIRICLVVN